MIAYLECSTGVSGDKFLGALIGAGFDPQGLRDALDALGLTAVSVTVETRASAGVTGIGVTVSEEGAPNRGWRELRHLLEGSPLDAAVRDSTLHALRLLAEAEAEVHGVPLEDVHFHEIGAADTIVDVLGVALGLHELGITQLAASPVAVGSGSVRTAHGELAVPAPATALLLRDLPIVPGSTTGELTTPTGAALLAAFAGHVGPMPPMTLRRVGVGCGTRDIGEPNVCRLLVGEAESVAPGRQEVVVLETNLDHLTPEEVAHAAERLREAGALDVWQTPIVMKKGRAAVLLSVLAPVEGASRLAERVLAETGTLGVRLMPAERLVTDRDVFEIATSLGQARFKTSFVPGTGRVLRLEADDAARIAAERRMPSDAVARQLEAEAARMTGIQPMRQTPSLDEANPSD